MEIPPQPANNDQFENPLGYRQCIRLVCIFTITKVISNIISNYMSSTSCISIKTPNCLMNPQIEKMLAFSSSTVNGVHFIYQELAELFCDPLTRSLQLSSKFDHYTVTCIDFLINPIEMENIIKSCPSPNNLHWCKKELLRNLPWFEMMTKLPNNS